MEAHSDKRGLEGVYTAIIKRHISHEELLDVALQVLTFPHT